MLLIQSGNKRFIRSETDKDASWEQRVAKKYYDTLFKEYAICELKYYKQGKIALRWRTEKEVVAGKGQFICGSTRCDASNELKSWEVNFGYVEDGEKKNELVKVRLCPECSDSLNYKTQKRQAKSKKMEDKKNKRKRTHSEEEDDDNEEDEDHEDHDRKGKKSKRSSDKYGNVLDALNSTISKYFIFIEHNDDRKSEHANSIWSKPIESKEERTKEEEYEDYFADLLQ